MPKPKPPMRWFNGKSKVDFARVGEVYLKGRDVTELCAAFYGPEEPDIEAKGVVVFVLPLAFSCDGTTNALAYTRKGKVRWTERKAPNA